MDNVDYSVVVVGGGAAGLMAAGIAAQRGERVLLLEKMEKTGRKVRISGKGRCNLTNTRPEEEFLEKIQVNRDFFRSAFRQFSNRALMNFFERLGVALETQHGERVFPKSGKAWDIAQALVDWCREMGVRIECEARVTEILTFNGRIMGVRYRNARNFERKVEVPNVILATGGATYPATGSTGDGYAFANAVGHTIVPIRPSLVPLETDYAELPFLAGLLLKNIGLRLISDGQTVAEEQGEMLFSRRGLEGAVILRVSRMAVDALIDGHELEVSLDLKRAMDAEELRSRIMREIEAQPSDITIAELFRKLVPRELVIPLAKRVDVNSRRPVSQLTEGNIDDMVTYLKDFRIRVTDYRPFEEAVVTAGGVDVSEVDPETMESRIVSGLYLAGEVLDLDANTGGYNLQIAFSTGHLAGQLRHRRA